MLPSLKNCSSSPALLACFKLFIATISLSSTAGAAGHQGGSLGEFEEAGEHGGRPYYRQKDTEGNKDAFLYSEGGKWLVSNTLGEINC